MKEQKTLKHINIKPELHREQPSTKTMKKAIKQ